MTREEEIIERIRDICYWEGSGEELLEWVTIGYTENDRGRRQHNLDWKPFASEPQPAP